MAKLFRKGKTWWVTYYVGKRRRRESLRTTDIRIAKRKLGKLEYEASVGELELPSATPLVPFLEVFCEHLRTIRPTPKGYKNDISYLRTIFGPVCSALEPRSTVNHRHRAQNRIKVKDQLARRHIDVNTLEELTAARIEEYITLRIRLDGIAPKTANRIREILHLIFAYAVRQRGFRSADRRHPNPVDAVPRRREDAPMIRFLSAEEIDEQLEVLRDWPVLQTIVAVLIYAGLRREECLWLTRADVKLEAGMISVCRKEINGETWRPKTKRNRRVPISSALRGYLESSEPIRDCIWFFPSPRGRRWDPDNFSQTLRNINRENGLTWSSLDFRHTFGSHLAMKGESLYKIATLRGNSPDICRRHYATLIPEQMRDTVEFPARVVDGSADNPHAVELGDRAGRSLSEAGRERGIPRLRLIRE